MCKNLSLALAAFMIPLALFAQMQSNQSEQLPPSIESADNFVSSAEFLFWRADVDGTALVTTERTINTVSTKEAIELDGKWEPGCRLIAGYHFGFFDQWDFVGTWTYYHGRSNDESRTANGTTTFLRQGWSPFLGPVATFARGHWSLNMNLADLELARSYAITPRLTMHPHAGIRGGWVDLSYLSRYTGVWSGVDALLGEAFTLSRNTDFKGKSDFGGGGLVAGNGLRWTFNDNWAFWGNLTASLLYGRFHVKESFHGADFPSISIVQTPTAPSLVNVTEKYRERFNRVRGTLDFLFGLEARTKFNKDRARMTFFLGYELFELFRFNELFSVVRSLNGRILSVDLDPEEGNEFIEDIATDAQFNLENISNDIGFQGVTAKVEFEF